MGSVKVTVYGRIKPRQNSCQNQEYKLKYGEQEDQVSFPASKSSGKRIFRFKKIFGEDASQQQVFETVAKPLIKSVFLGYNGTIFTYGQTGSGKTHTMTGSLEDWVDTGLVPRTIQEVFQLKENDTVISITYFEIYNERVYDLIKSDKMESVGTAENQVEETATVTSFRNLSVHTVKSVCEALVLYRRGEANKMVAETSSNARSSRSHVIFSIAFEFPHPKEELLSLKPVLYLVDLAGSERITKCKSHISNLWETRYINLSLHYLEQVLVALRQPGRVHIPYRNSLMTALLKNSLGGNCITAMIATFSMSVSDAEETLHTCRFAERLALIKNEVRLSELTNPQKAIESLKKENERLKTQIKLLSKEQVCEQLTEKDKEKCNEMVQSFLEDDDFFALPLTDIRRMEFCFSLMRNEILRERIPSFFRSEKKRIPVTLTPTESRILEDQDEEADDNNNYNSTEKNSKRKRNPIELPRINITYKRWKSIETLTDKEKVSTKKSNVKGVQQCEKSEKNKNHMQRSCTTLQFDDLKKAPEYLEDKENSGRPKSSNFALKFSGESNNENINFISFSSSKNGDTIENKIDNDKNSKRLKSKNLQGEDFSAVCVPLTGDQDVDEEILKFYESRYHKLKDK